MPKPFVQADATQRFETFTPLNGLRFLAALAVVIFHYAPRVDVYPRVPAFVKNLINEGPAAVSFFFILSGFVLGYRHLYGGSRVQTAATFYWARFVRLYPAYLLAFLLFLPVALQRYVFDPLYSSAGRHTFAVSAVLSGLMLQSWTPLAQAWNGPSWSLSVEAFMYLMFPVIGFPLAKLTGRQTAFVLAVAWAIPSSLALAYVQHWIPDPTWRLYVTNNPLLWMPLFVMGICASRMVAAWAKVPRSSASIASTLAFVALILVAFSWPHRWNDVFVTGGIAPLFLVLIVFFTRASGWIARAIGGRVLGKLGEASYIVYILQAPLWHYWQLLTNFLRRVPAQTNTVPPWQFVAFVPFLVLTSLAVQRSIEIPIRTSLVNWKHGNSASPALSPASS